jgi:hypothetical protein
MPADHEHRRAQTLLDQITTRDEGVSSGDERWLAGHLAGCTVCSEYAEVSRRTVRALDSFAFDLDPEAALRVQMAVRGRAVELGSGGRVFAVAVPVAAVLTLLGSIAAWVIIAWMAGQWKWPSPAWQIAFTVLWLLPSILLDAVIVFRKNWMDEEEGS